MGITVVIKDNAWEERSILIFFSKPLKQAYSLSDENDGMV